MPEETTTTAAEGAAQLPEPAGDLGHRPADLEDAPATNTAAGEIGKDKPATEEVPA